MKKEKLRKEYYEAIDELRKALYKFQDVILKDMQEEGDYDTFNRLFAILEEEDCPIKIDFNEFLFRLDNWLMELKSAVQKYL